MSWLPFVSRGRYEDAMHRVAELEEERKLLLDRLLSKPLFHEPPTSPNSPSIEGEKEEVEPPRPARPTLARIRAMANDAKRAAAQKESPNMKVGA